MGQIICMNYEDVGGGGKVFLVTVNHPEANGTTIKTGQSELTGESLIYSGMTQTCPDSHTASSLGGVFDFTLTITSSISVRLHSSAYTNKYILADFIVNGTTVESDIQIDTFKSLDFVYTVSFGVLV